jgi:hypothetical protein
MAKESKLRKFWKSKGFAYLLSYIVVSVFNLAYRYTVFHLDTQFVQHFIADQFIFWRAMLLNSFIWFLNPVILIIDIILVIGVYYLIRGIQRRLI